MAKYHINDKKEVGVCKASVQDCKFGNATEHFNDKEEAEAQASKELAKEYGVVSAAYKAGGEQDDRVKNMSPELKKRMIEDSAAGKAPLAPAVVGKVFAQDRDELVRRRVASKITSQNLLRKMSDDESSKVRAHVAATTNNPHVLRKLAQDGDSEVRNAALKNQRMPKRDKKKTQEAIKAAAVAKRKKTEAAKAKKEAPSVNLSHEANYRLNAGVRELKPEVAAAMRKSGKQAWEHEGFDENEPPADGVPGDYSLHVGEKPVNARYKVSYKSDLNQTGVTSSKRFATRKQAEDFARNQLPKVQKPYDEETAQFEASRLAAYARERANLPSGAYTGD